VRGTFAPDRFFVRGGQAYANGLLRATMRRANGSVVGTTSRRITVPVKGGSDAARGGCSRREVPDPQPGARSAESQSAGCGGSPQPGQARHRRGSGPGNLLGNLLCAVANLLNGDGSPLNLLRLVNVLNRILAVLRIG
jgi:hypothetical protein